MYNIATSVKKHRLYADFEKVKARLAAHQFVCWIAGGAVRDFCLNREVSEFDLVTDATTEVLKALFPEALLVGESFGVLKLAVPGGDFFDLTSFRQESDYLDGRRPSHVSSATPVKDSERRDFTINSLFWDDVRGLIIDYRGGLFDLFRKKLICVGNPEVRFSEDYLRIIRLVRFSAQLNFEIDEKTYEAALKHYKKINKVSGERIWSELKKIGDAKAWNFVLRQELFMSLLSEVFESHEIKIKSVPAKVTNIFLIIYLLNPEHDFSETLKLRLKISNRELGVYKTLRFIMKSLARLDVEEWAYEIEKSPLVAEQMKCLVDSGLVGESLELSIRNVLSLYPETLLKPQELLEVVPNRFISEELRLLRIGQFKKVFRTKGEALDYLKKKHAAKPENT